MKNIGLSLAALVLLLAMPIGAAAADTFSILSFDNGYAPAYNLQTGNWNVASEFSLNVQVADPLSASFVLINGDGTIVPNYKLLRLNYQILDRARLGAMIGSSGTNLVSGLGFDVVAFRKKFQDAIASEFKLQINYLFQPAVAPGISGGLLFFGLAFSIGV